MRITQSVYMNGCANGGTLEEGMVEELRERGGLSAARGARGARNMQPAAPPLVKSENDVFDLESSGCVPR